MDKTAAAALALRMMEAIQPNAPWKSTYATTAEAFGEVAAEAPLFSGERGVARTVSLFVSLAWFEGSLKPDIEGDCEADAKGKCTKPAQSLCTFQVGVTHLASLGTTRTEILSDIKVCTKSARSLIATSMKVCASKPRPAWLGWYAAGGEGCDRALDKSAHRMNKAEWLFTHYPAAP